MQLLVRILGQALQESNGQAAACYLRNAELFVERYREVLCTRGK